MSQIVNVDRKLAVNKFNLDQGDPHIVLVESANLDEFKKLVNACPAGLYRINPDQSLHFDPAGCLECGTCRVLCGETILEKWQYPRGTFGIEYRYG